MGALFLVVSTPRPERPSEQAARRQGFWPWIGKYQASGICKHIYPRVGRGAVAVFEVESNEVLHRILNEWADIIPAEFDVYPLVDLEATHKMLAAQVAANTKRTNYFAHDLFGTRFILRTLSIALKHRR